MYYTKKQNKKEKTKNRGEKTQSENLDRKKKHKINRLSLEFRMKSIDCLHFAIPISDEITRFESGELAAISSPGKWNKKKPPLCFTIFCGRESHALPTQEQKNKTVQILVGQQKGEQFYFVYVVRRRRIGAQARFNINRFQRRSR